MVRPSVVLLSLTASVALAFAILIPGPAMRAQDASDRDRPGISDIRVDTEQGVLAPDGSPINSYGGMTTLADEHSTIFSPGKLPGPDRGSYLFFVVRPNS